MSLISHDEYQCAVERAILKTILYSDLFDYALTPAEIAHYLIKVPGSAEMVQASLAAPVWLDGQLARVEGYITVRGHESLVERRHERARSSDRLWQHARRFIRALACLPFVRMVGVTGALAMDNSTDGDDIDVMIVTAPNRVWLARAFTVMLVYVGKLFGDTLCPNHVISENVLALENRSLFVAHEFVQMVPVYGLAVYARMRAANPWIEAVLPNATRPYHAEPEHQPGLIGCALKRLGEWLSSGRIGDRLEEWEMRRKICKFQSQLGQPDSDAILDRDHVKGHFEDYGAPVLRLYRRRLADFGLQTGDWDESNFVRPIVSSAI